MPLSWHQTQVVRKAWCWLHRWDDLYPAIQSTHMHTQARTKRAITFMGKERAAFVEINNVLSPCPHIHWCAPAHSIKASPCKPISRPLQGALEPRHHRLRHSQPHKSTEDTHTHIHTLQYKPTRIQSSIKHLQRLIWWQLGCIHI